MTIKAGIDAQQACNLCGGRFTIRAIIERISSFWPEVDVVVSETPCCHALEELRIENKRVWRGYIYAAGAPHFCGVEEYEVPTLELKRKDSVLVFELDGVEQIVEKNR